MKLCKVLLASLAFSFASAAFAGKVAVLNFKAAAMNTEAAKTSFDEFKGKPDVAKMIADIEGIEAELADLDKDYKAKGLTWSEDQVAEFRRKAEYLQSDRQNLLKKFNTERQALMDRLISDAAKKVPAILDKISKAEDIDLVVNAEAVMHISSESINLTAKVVEELNKAK